MLKRENISDYKVDTDLVTFEKHLQENRKDIILQDQPNNNAVRLAVVESLLILTQTLIKDLGPMKSFLVALTEDTNEEFLQVLDSSTGTVIAEGLVEHTTARSKK